MFESPLVDPRFFLGGGAPLRNGITDWRKQILNINVKKKASSHEGARPLHPPPKSVSAVE